MKKLTIDVKTLGIWLGLMSSCIFGTYTITNQINTSKEETLGIRIDEKDNELRKIKKNIDSITLDLFNKSILQKKLISVDMSVLGGPGSEKYLCSNSWYEWKKETYHDSEKALLYMDLIIRLNPESPEAYKERGTIYKSLRLPKRAIADFNKALQLNHKYAEAYYYRGKTIGKYEDALKDFAKAIEYSPYYADVYFSMGHLYCRLDKCDKAIEAFSKAIEINPYYPLAYYNRGVVYFELGKFELAINDFSNAIDIDPTHGFSFSFRASCYLNLGEITKACQDMKKSKQYGGLLKGDIKECSDL